MSYFGNVADRSSRASIGFISLAGTRTPSGVLALEPLHRRMPTLPSHPQGALQDHLPAVQQHPVPLLLQRRPAPLDRVVLAVIRRIVHQADLQARPIGELHHPLEELRPPPRVLRPVVQVDHQPLDRPQARPDLGPPHPQRIDPGVAGLVRTEQEHQRPAGHHQDAEWGQLLLRRRVMVPALGHLTGGVGPGFSPPDVIAQGHLRLGVHGDLQRLGIGPGLLPHGRHVGEDRVGLLGLLQRLALLDPLEAVVHPVEDVPHRPFAGQFRRGIALGDQGVAHLGGRQVGVAPRRTSTPDRHRRGARRWRGYRRRAAGPCPRCGVGPAPRSSPGIASPARASWSPLATVSRPQPKRRSAWRGLPSQSAVATSARKARRRKPVSRWAPERIKASSGSVAVSIGTILAGEETREHAIISQNSTGTKSRFLG